VDIYQVVKQCNQKVLTAVFQEKVCFFLNTPLLYIIPLRNIFLSPSKLIERLDLQKEE
jgi:hypothetical protein